MVQNQGDESFDVEGSLRQLYDAVQNPETYDRFPQRNGTRIQFEDLLDHYPMDHLFDRRTSDTGIENLLDNIAEEKGFMYRKTANLYMNLSLNGNNPDEVKDLLQDMEENGVQSHMIRQFKPMLETSIEELLEE